MKEGIGFIVSKHRVKYIPFALHGGIVHIPCKRDDVNGITEEYIKTFVSEKRGRKYIDITHILDNISEDQLRYTIPGLKDKINQKSIYNRVLQFSGKDDNYNPALGALIIFSTSYTVTIELTESLLITYSHFKECLDDCYQEHIDNDFRMSSAIDVDFEFRRGYEPECHADSNFDESISQLSEEIRERINKLKILGVEESFIKALFEPKKTLSRLLITKDYRIFLPDYGNIEIKMEPLPKAVYLLFLKYDSGIVFKELPFYHYDLRKIYVCVTKSYNLDIAENSLERVLDPTNNSINEKCSRIREAFVSQIDESIARNYYINGKRACPKRIALDRKLLITEVDL